MNRLVLQRHCLCTRVQKSKDMRGAGFETAVPHLNIKDLHATTHKGTHIKSGRALKSAKSLRRGLNYRKHCGRLFSRLFPRTQKTCPRSSVCRRRAVARAAERQSSRDPRQAEGRPSVGKSRKLGREKHHASKGASHQRNATRVCVEAR